MIFVNLIYGHFDILMSQYDQMNIKVMLFRAAPKWYLGSILQGLGTQIHSDKSERLRFPWFPPRYPQTSSRHPPDTPQTSPGNPRCHQTTTYANRHRQTPLDTDRCCLSMSGNVCSCVLSSVNILYSLGMVGRCLGGVWWVSEGCLSGIHGKHRHSDVFGGILGSQSLQYGA